MPTLLDPLEKELATHSSIFAWEIPCRDEPDGLQSMGSQRVGDDWMYACACIHTHTHTQTLLISKSKGYIVRRRLFWNLSLRHQVHVSVWFLGDLGDLSSFFPALLESWWKYSVGVSRQPDSWWFWSQTVLGSRTALPMTSYGIWDK